MLPCDVTWFFYLIPDLLNKEGVWGGVSALEQALPTRLVHAYALQGVP